jgi:hypothetical protein
MTFPTSLNDQITDAVTQSTLASFGAARATALAVSQQTWAQAMGLGFQNAVTRQQNGHLIAEALMAKAVETLSCNKTGAGNG